MERIPAYEGTEPFLFISYAHKNTASVMPVIETLFHEKYRVWYDEGIAAGSEWPQNIEEHLRKAAAVIVFVSEESLASPNCENEVSNAKPQSRPVIQFQLSTKEHPGLKNCQNVHDTVSLMEVLPSSLIGDGKTGYERGVGITRTGNFWTSLLVIAAALILLLALGIYALQTGRLDPYLPGLASPEETAPPTESPQLIESGNLLAQAAAVQTKDQLLKEVVFRSEETRKLLHEALHFDEKEHGGPLTYLDLTADTVSVLWLEYANDELLELLAYLPELEILQIHTGEISSLRPLLNYPELQVVQIGYTVFPVEIPSDASFQVEYLNVN